MKCEICRTEVPREKNSVVCSDKCQQVRLEMFRIDKKYFPTNGCDNCWGDLGGKCSEQCNKEFRASSGFWRDMWSLIRVIYPEPVSHKQHSETGGSKPNGAGGGFIGAKFREQKTK